MTGATETDDTTIAAELGAELERLQTCDPFAALGVTPSSGEAEIRAAFLALTKAYHPNRFARRSHEVARLANEVYLEIKSAYGLLADAEGRRREQRRLAAESPSASSSTAIPRADSQPVPSGEAAGASKLDDGLRARRRAARQKAVRKRAERVGRNEELPTVAPPADPLEAVRRRQEAFAAARRTLGKGEFVAARQEFHRLAIEDPQRKELRVYLHYAWGREHEGTGDADNAIAEYNRALKLDPGFDEARLAMAALRKKAKTRGLFSKLFGK